MRRDAGAIIAAVVMFACGAQAAEPAYLSADELRSLMVGKTIEARSQDGSTFRVYFDADGRRLALQPNGDEYALPWRILPDGTQCVMTGTGDDCARVLRNDDGTYSRVRDGQAVTRWQKIAAGKDLGSLAPGMYARLVAPDKYLLLLVALASVTEQQAHARMALAADAVCKTQVPVLGLYHFDSTQRISPGASPTPPGEMRFTQEVSCVEGVRPAPIERRPTLQSSEESQRVQQEVRTKTEAYFRLIAAGRIDEAYTHVDGPGMGMDASTWKTGKRSFQLLTGEPIQLTISKITVYDNPAEAPAAGLYVAADYTNEYQNVPLHCGYLMWFRPVGGEFRINREETGIITAEELKTIPAADLAVIKRKLRCTSPEQEAR